MDLSKNLHKLEKGDIKKASEVLSRAFLQDPDLVKNIPNEEMRKMKLKIMFEPFIRFGMIYVKSTPPHQISRGLQYGIIPQ
jgi:hypothetical protein